MKVQCKSLTNILCAKISCSVNKNGLGNFDQIFLQKPKACKNPCKYKSWEGWGSFSVNDPLYPATVAAVAAGYPEVRNERQRMGTTVFPLADIKTQLPAAAADSTKFPMR